MELNTEQIIKALECYVKKPHISECEKGCIYYEKSFGSYCCCMPLEDTLIENALTLINSQEQRMKELSEENERLRAEEKRGYWFTDYARQPMAVCSNCNLSNNYSRSKYCPHCGARMDGK